MELSANVRTRNVASSALRRFDARSMGGLLVSTGGMLRWYTIRPLFHKEQGAPASRRRPDEVKSGMSITEPALVPQVVSVNVGLIREVEWRGTTVRTGIWKQPVGPGPVALRGVNLDGDDQADRRVHGGVDKAVYAYAEEDYRYWEAEEGVRTQPGLFGEISR